MKTNLKQFQNDFNLLLEHYYKQSLSQRIKMGLKHKKLSTKKDLKCKVL